MPFGSWYCGPLLASLSTVAQQMEPWALGLSRWPHLRLCVEGETEVHPGVRCRELGWRLGWHWRGVGTGCGCRGVCRSPREQLLSAQQDTRIAPGMSHPAYAGNGKPTCTSD